MGQFQAARWVSFGAAAAVVGTGRDDHADSQDAVALNNRGEMLMQAGDLVGARELLMEAISRSPSSAAPWSNLAVALSRGGFDSEATRAFVVALSLESSAPTLVSFAAHKLRGSKAPDVAEEALALCDQALAMDSRSVSSHVTRATALNRLGRHAEAVQAGEAARQLDPGSPSAWTELGFAYFKIERRSKARDCAKRALRIDSKFVAAKNLLEAIAVEKG